MSIINTVINNRKLDCSAAASEYGLTDKELNNRYDAIKGALYNWSVAENNHTDVNVAIEACFDALKPVLSVFNAELDDGRKLKFTRNGENNTTPLSSLRDRAFSMGWVETDKAKGLKQLKSVCLYRLKRENSMSYNHLALDVLVLVNINDIDKDITAETAENVLERIESAIQTLKNSGEYKYRDVKFVGSKNYRKDCEDYFAQMLEKELAKTAEELAQMRKDRNAKQRKTRRSEKRD